MKIRNSLRVLAPILVAPAAALFSSCKNPVGSDIDLSGSHAPASTATVAVRSSGFDPPSVTVQPGGQVTFENQDGVAHQLASTCPELNSPPIAAGARLPVRMGATVGTCSYHDPADPSRTGTIQRCHEIGLFSCR
jgi:plastocyanin